MVESGTDSSLNTILVVEDEPLARLAIMQILTDRFPTFTVIGEADSGPSGLELFRKLRPSIILMDVGIPGFNGLETARLILRESPETQIIVLSAYDDFKFVQEALHDGVLGYLLKPVKEESLREQLDKAVGKISILKSREGEKGEIRVLRSLAVREQVASFIYGSKGGIPALTFAELSHPPIQYGYFIVFRIEKDFRITAEEIKKVNYSLDRLAGCLPGDWMGQYLPIFITTENDNPEAWRSEGEFLSREIKHLIQDIAGGRIDFGIGPVVAGPKNFADSFRVAFDSLQDHGHSSRILDRYPVEKEAVFL
ncbi:MAG: response regulator, partial [Spirochaetaceae bacterium]|nr:response regulator [Spirochaetaceae bacterium]